MGEIEWLDNVVCQLSKGNSLCWYQQIELTHYTFEKMLSINFLLTSPLKIQSL